MVDIMGWDDAVSGSGEDLVSGDDYSSMGDDFVMGAEEDIQSLLAAGDDYGVSGDAFEMSGAGPLVRRAPWQMNMKRAALMARKKRAACGPKKQWRRFPIGLTLAGPNGTTTGFDLPDGSPINDPGQTFSVTSNPQIPFRGERITIPSNIAKAFFIDDVKVGNRSQLVSSDGLPGAAFSETGYGVALRLDLARVSQDITIVFHRVATFDGVLDTFDLTTTPISIDTSQGVPFRAVIMGLAYY